MSIKASKSLQFNGVSWGLSLLGEEVILLECSSSVPIEKIHKSTHELAIILEDQLLDIVPAYQSIAVFCSLSPEELHQLLAGKFAKTKQSSTQSEIIELPICYELGLDLNRIARHSGLSIDQVISIHLNSVYRSLFIGFTPGFIYADGLDERLNCPRLDSPRTKIPAGSIGIGGNQTGIYSLESPGGWNILGRTPLKVFDMNRKPPMLIDVGTSYQFKQITKQEFDSWEN